MDEKYLTYRRIHRSIACLTFCSVVILCFLVCCSRRTDWTPGKNEFTAEDYNKMRGDIYDRDGNLLVTSYAKSKENPDRMAYFRDYTRLGPEYANAIGFLTFVNRYVEDPQTKEIKAVRQVKLEGKERGKLAQWLLTGNKDATRTKGGSVQLTIDSKIQKVSYNALLDFKNKYYASQNQPVIDKKTKKKVKSSTKYCRYGAAVVMDIRTGEIISYVDIPSINYQELMAIENEEDYFAYFKGDNDGALNDFCTKGQTPGSTFKILSASVLCDLGMTNKKVNDKGVFHYGGDAPKGEYIYDHDAKKDAKGNRIPVPKGKCDLSKGIAQSLNVVFVEMSKDLDREKVRDEYRDIWHLNIGYRLGEDKEKDAEECEANSTIQMDFGSMKQSCNIDNDQLYYDTSYGKGKLLVSPLYICAVTAAVAREDGNLMRPYMCKTFYDADGKEVSYKTATNGLKQGDVLTKHAVSPEARKVIMKGMEGCAAINKNKLTVKGVGIKTGTAELTGKDNIWMTGYVNHPKTGEPRYAVTVAMFETKADTLFGADLGGCFSKIASALQDEMKNNE